MKRSKVTLEAEERPPLSDLIAAGRAAARKLTDARLRLQAAAAAGPAWPEGRIAEAREVSVATVERAGPRWVEPGRDAARDRPRRERPAREPKRDGRAEAPLLALAGSAPPEGRAVGTRQLLADQLLERQLVDSSSDETVRLALTKTRSSPGGRSGGASRRRRTPSWAASGRRGSMSPTGPPTRRGPGSAWTRPASRGSAR